MSNMQSNVVSSFEIVKLLPATVKAVYIKDNKPEEKF